MNSLQPITDLVLRVACLVFARRIPGYPDTRISGYPDIRISGYPDIRVSGYPGILRANTRHATRSTRSVMGWSEFMKHVWGKDIEMLMLTYRPLKAVDREFPNLVDF